MENDKGSKELSRKFDIVLEMEKALDQIDEAFDLDDTSDVPEQIAYLRFLVKDLDDIFSDENENLRYRGFTIKRG